MKKHITFCILSFSLLIGCSPKSENAGETPTIVKESFNKLFSGATNVQWSKESDSEYEAEFKVGEVKKSANFDQFGKWLVTETEIKISDLPAAVQSTVTNEFSGYSIEEAELAEPSGGSMFYEIELESGEVNIEVQISSEGKVLKKEEMKEKEDDKEKD